MRETFGAAVHLPRELVKELPMASDIEDLNARLISMTLPTGWAWSALIPRATTAAPITTIAPPPASGRGKYPDGWYDHSAQRGGDCIDLVQYVLAWVSGCGAVVAGNSTASPRRSRSAPKPVRPRWSSTSPRKV